MDIKPEERVMIAALRAGRGSQQAFMDYCWSKAVVPIEWPTWSDDPRDPNRNDSPFDCRPQFTGTMAEAMASDAFDEGKTDDEIVGAFRAGQEYDLERGIRYRIMKDAEHPSAADLIRAMDIDDKVWAAGIFGIRPVANAIMGGEIDLAPTETRSAKTPKRGLARKGEGGK